jgi:hypothetical protein
MFATRSSQDGINNRPIEFGESNKQRKDERELLNELVSIIYCGESTAPLKTKYRGESTAPFES